MMPGPNQPSAKVVTVTTMMIKEVNVADYEPITDSKNVEKYVNDYFAGTPILADIAGCESRYRQFNKNGDPLRGEKNRFDVGVMQINELYHAEKALELELDIYSIEGNVAYAKYLYEKSGAKPWMSSSPCWAKFHESSIAKR